MVRQLNNIPREGTSGIERVKDITFSFQLNDILVFEFGITDNTLLVGSYKSVSACLASDMPARFAHWRIQSEVVRKSRADIKQVRLLTEE